MLMVMSSHRICVIFDYRIHLTIFILYSSKGLVTLKKKKGKKGVVITATKISNNKNVQQ